jgi:hypothetical protein
MVILEKNRKKYQIWTNNDEEILVTTFDCRLKGEMGIVIHWNRTGLKMAAGRVSTRNLQVLDPSGSGSGALYAPRVCGFGDPKWGGEGAGFDSPPRVPIGDPIYGIHVKNDQFLPSPRCWSRGP